MTEPLVAAVIGSPISQSLSPVIHEAAFRAQGRPGVYAAIECTAENISSVVASVRRAGAVGLSVTMPCKEMIIGLCDVLDSTAQVLRAVNCVKFDDDRIAGYNTDGDGCCDALVEQGSVVLEGARAVVLGAGGTARSVALGLLRRGAHVVVINRTASRADAVVEALSDVVGVSGTIETGVAFDVASADIVVNATSVGMGTTDSPVEAGAFRPGMTVLDAVYHPIETSFLSAASSAGARTVDGLWMLIHQACRQQEIWFGVKPDAGPMRAESERVLRGRPTSL